MCRKSASCLVSIGRSFSPLHPLPQSIPNSARMCSRFCQLFVLFSSSLRGIIIRCKENRDWVEVEARMALENHSAYKGKGPVMHIISIKPCEKPANEVVTF